MSAATSDSSDREPEALSRAQRAHEPSMEEILASIRNIIADDRGAAKLAAPRPAPTRPAPASPGPQIVYSQDPPRAPQAPGLDPGAARDPEVVRTFAAAAQKVAAWRQPEPSDSKPPPEPEATQDEPLMSPEAASAVALAFEALSASVAARAAEVADGMVRDMLRPMLKTWLDENLPAMVERLVRSEIERIARGTR